LIDNKIKSPLSRRVLFGDLVDGGKVTVDLQDNELTFAVSEMIKPLTKEEKKALKAKKAAELQETQKDENTENQTNQ
jgi:hypothetical protein